MPVSWARLCYKKSWSHALSKVESPLQVGGIMAMERRTSARLPVRLRLLFPWKDRIMQAHTLDVSSTGMRLETLADLGLKTRLIVHFAMAGETVTQRLEGSVQWVRPPTPPGQLYTCGFHFDAMSDNARQSLERVLAAAAPQEVLEVGDQDVVEMPEYQPHTAFASQLTQAVHSDQGRHAERRREADALGREGTYAASTGELVRATQLLEQALTLAPDSRELTEELARILYLRGEVVRAAELFDRALRLAQEQS